MGRGNRQKDVRMDGLSHKAVELLEHFQVQLAILGVAGVAGAFFRAVFWPEKDWKRRVMQSFAGIVAAIFLGGIVADMIIAFIGPERAETAWLASGFLMSATGEVAVKKLQEHLVGNKK